jgi:hypothetical protein
MLNDVDFRIAQKAAAEIIKTSAFPPTIAEFRLAAKGVTDKEENEVTHHWLSVRYILKFEIPAARMSLLSERAKTVVMACGGLDVLDKLEGIGAYNAFTGKYRDMLRREKSELLGSSVKQIGGR